MDIAAGPLEATAAYARKLVQQNGFNTRIEVTTDRRKALDGADYVLVAIIVGGGQSGDIDRADYSEARRRPGDISPIGPVRPFMPDSPCAIMLGICHDMEELCPDAWLLNYTNPMPPIEWAMTDYTRIKNIGLCHSIQNTSAELAKYVDVPYNEISYLVAGINHMAWFLEFKWQGKDAYPLLKEKFKNPAVYSGPDALITGRISRGRRCSKLSAITSPSRAGMFRPMYPISANTRRYRTIQTGQRRKVPECRQSFAERDRERNEDFKRKMETITGSRWTTAASSAP